MPTNSWARDGAAALSLLLTAGVAHASPDQDRANVAALDTALVLRELRHRQPTVGTGFSRPAMS